MLNPAPFHPLQAGILSLSLSLYAKLECNQLQNGKCGESNFGNCTLAHFFAEQVSALFSNFGRASSQIVAELGAQVAK